MLHFIFSVKSSHGSQLDDMPEKFQLMLQELGIEKALGCLVALATWDTYTLLLYYKPYQQNDQS